MDAVINFFITVFYIDKFKSNKHPSHKHTHTGARAYDRKAYCKTQHLRNLTGVKCMWYTYIVIL